MELPSVTDLNEFNRVLLAVTQLSEPKVGCRVGQVVALCSSITFGGHPVDHYRTLKLCKYAKLLSITNGTIVLTEFGRQFLNLNSPGYYEVTNQQKDFIAGQLILDGPWQSHIRDLFLSFSPNYEKLTYDISVSENPLPVRHNSAIHLLLALEVLERKGNKLSVNPMYVSVVKCLRAANNGMSMQELEEALQTNMKLADQAEEAVLEYERARLESINCHAEASLVRRISQLDVKAGYDIESFNGDRPLFDYDRFIEVKSSYGSALRFFWSDNERRAAQEKCEKYWIYFLGGLGEKKAKQAVPILIQNPLTRLTQMPGVAIKVATYLVEQSGEIQLKGFHQGKIKGLLL